MGEGESGTPGGPEPEVLLPMEGAGTRTLPSGKKSDPSRFCPGFLGIAQLSPGPARLTLWNKLPARMHFLAPAWLCGPGCRVGVGAKMAPQQPPGERELLPASLSLLQGGGLHPPPPASLFCLEASSAGVTFYSGERKEGGWVQPAGQSIACALRAPACHVSHTRRGGRQPCRASGPQGTPLNWPH